MARPSRRAPCLRPPLLAVTLLALLAPLAPLAAAGADPLAKEFSKQAKAALKELKPLPGLAAKEVGQELGALLAQVKAGDLGVAEAVAGAVALLNSRAGEVATSVVEATVVLRDAGVALGPVEGPDFEAGGRGAWDGFLEDAEALLAKTDGLFGKKLEAFRKQLEQAAAKAGTPADVHFRLRDHDRRLFRVVPPASVGVTTSDAPPADFDIDVPPAQVYLLATIQDVDHDQLLELGIQAFGRDVFDIDIVTSGGTTSLAGQAVDGTGTAQLSHDLGSALGGPVRIDLNPDPKTGADDQAGIARASVTEAPGFQATLKEFKQQANADFKFFVKISGQELKDYKQDAKGILADWKSGLIPTQPAILALDNAAATAQLGTSLWYRIASDNPTYNAQVDLENEAIPADLIPDEFLPDGGGFYAKHVSRMALKHDVRCRQLELRLSKDIDKLAGQAQKAGEHVAVHLVDLPMLHAGAAFVTTQADPVDQVRVQPHATRGLAIAWDTGLGIEVAANYTGYADQVATPTVVGSVVSVDEGESLVIGGLVPSLVGGLVHDQVPMLADVPLLARFFSIDRHADKRKGLLILTQPKLLLQEM